MEITSAGFDNSADALLQVQPGGRFIIRSSDYTRDVIGAIGFSESARANVNHTVLDGWTGADPASGNVYFTNRRGSIDAPNEDRPPISRVYDRTAAFDFTQTGDDALAWLQGAAGSAALGRYTVLTGGAFADPMAGTDKPYTVAATNNVVAQMAGNGSAIYGLRYASFTRPAGPVGASGPGHAISEITPRPVLATGVDAVDRVYDGTRTVALDIGAAVLSGVLAGDSVTLAAGTATGTMAGKHVGIDKPVLAAGALLLSGTDARNYVLTDLSQPTVTITARPVVPSGITAVDRIYDGTTAVALDTSHAALAGTVAGDDVGYALGSPSGTMADKHIGTGKPVTLQGTQGLFGADAGDYTLMPAAPLAVTIAPRAITSSGITGVDRVYDGTTSVTLNTSAMALSGAIAGDDVGLVTGSAVGRLADKNVGAAKPVAIGGLTLGGTDAGNYTLGDASTATATITPRALVSSGIAGIDRIYDGTTSVALNTSAMALSGAIAGDDVGLVTGSALGRLVDKNVGSAKPVAISGLALGGTDAGNYTLGDASMATATITPRGLVSSGITGIDRVYDSTTSVALNTSAMALSGAITGDDVGLVTGSAVGRLADKNVGAAKPVAISGLTLGGTDAGNYTLGDASMATATITPRGLVSSGIAGIDRIYDGTTSVALNTSAMALSGAITGDDVGLVTGSAVGRLADKNVGAAKPVAISGLTLGGADAGNYTLGDASTATATITPRGLVSSGIAGIDRIYDGTTSVALNTSAATLGGAIAGDDVGLVTGSAVGRLANKNVGAAKPVAIGGLTLGGADAGNYTLGDASMATATITPRGLVSSGITGIDRVYDGTTSVTLNTSAMALSGAITGDDVGLVTGSAVGRLADKNVGAAKPVAISGLTLGGADANNYTLTDASTATATVTPRAVVSDGIRAVDRAYDGTVAVALTLGSATLTGAISGDDMTLNTSGAVGTMADKHVGIDKPVTVSGLALQGADAGNYMLVDTSRPRVTITALGLVPTGIGTVDRYENGTTAIELSTAGAGANGIVRGDDVRVDAHASRGWVAAPEAGDNKPATVTGLVLAGADAANYRIASQPVRADGSGLTVNIFPLPLAPATAPVPAPAPAVPVDDPQEPFRNAAFAPHLAAPPASAQLPAGTLALPIPPAVPLAVTVPPDITCEAPPLPKVAFERIQHIDTRTHYLYFPYRSATIDEKRSAAEQQALVQALGEDFQVRRVRGFTSPEGLRVPAHGFEGNDTLSQRRALAAVARLRDLCPAQGSACLAGDVLAEAGGELLTRAEAGPAGSRRETEGPRLAEHAVAAFRGDEHEAHQRTPEVEQALALARTPAEQAAVVFPQLRRAEIELTRHREIEQQRPVTAGPPTPGRCADGAQVAARDGQRR